MLNDQLGYRVISRRNTKAYNLHYRACCAQKIPFIVREGHRIKYNLLECEVPGLPKKQVELLNELWRHATCREKAHKYRHVVAAVGSHNGYFELCSHTIEDFDRELRAIIHGHFYLSTQDCHAE